MYGKKCIKFAYKIALKLKFSRGAALDPAGGLTAPPAGFYSHGSSWPDWLFFGGYGPAKEYYRT